MKGCEMCDPGDGCIYPYYGVAPHDSFHPIPDGVRIETVLHPESEWPANFTPTPDAGPLCGVYTHCLDCGAGAPPKREEPKP